MPNRATLEYVYAELQAAYEAAWQRVTDEEAALVNDPRRATRRVALSAMRERIEADMESLEAATTEWVQAEFPQAYRLGGIFGASNSGGRFVWSSTHQEAVQAAANDVYTDLLRATRHVKSSTRALIKRIARERLLAKIIEGESAVSAGRLMTRMLAQHGITAIVYSNGSRRGLADYGQMVMRTSSALAYNHATIVAAKDNGIKYYEIFDGPGCGLDSHDGIPAANGMIVTDDGAFASPLAHPNCTRSFGPRPDLTTRAEARLAAVL